jgi:hypothetical protein
MVSAILRLRVQQPGPLDRLIRYDQSQVLAYAPVTGHHHLHRIHRPEIHSGPGNSGQCGHDRGQGAHPDRMIRSTRV